MRVARGDAAALLREIVQIDSRNPSLVPGALVISFEDRGVPGTSPDLRTRSHSAGAPSERPAGAGGTGTGAGRSTWHDADDGPDATVRTTVAGSSPGTSASVTAWALTT